MRRMYVASILTAMVLITGLAQTARADYDFTYNGMVVGGTATINYAGLGGLTGYSFYTGIEGGTLKDNSSTSSPILNVSMFCVDIDHLSTTNNNPTDVPPLLDAVDGLQTKDYNKGTNAADKLDRAKAVRYVLDNYLPASGTTSSVDYTGYSDAQKAQKAQIAIWKIMVDGNGDITTGNLTASGFSTGVSATDINTLISTAWTNRNTVNYETYLIDTPNGAQDFGFRSSAPIPEPAFYQIAAFIGLGGMGLMRLRRRKA